MLGVSAPAAHAALTVPSQTYASLAQFEAAAGGADNGTNPGEQGSGFRHFNPAGIPVNGSDPGSTLIPGGHTVALASNRLQPWGIGLGPDVAVANDGFASVNSQAGFTPPDLWAPFNSDTTTFDIVAPAQQTVAATPALTRGLGIEFVHVENNGTAIQYYSGDALLDQVQVPQGATSFEGVLFAEPVVTRVVVTLGTAEIFGFDGGSVSQGSTNSSTLAAGEDVVQAEPGAGEATATGTAGVPVGVNLTTFESNDGATATIDWGDGSVEEDSIGNGAAGTFGVTGSHSYAKPGSYTVNVTVEDISGSEFETQGQITVAPRSTATSVTCSPSSVAVSATTTCMAVVSDASGGTPSSPAGLVTFSSPTANASFPGAGSCILGPTAAPGTSLCEVQFEAGQLPPSQARVIAGYSGDSIHSASQATTIVAVHKQRCALTALSRRVRPGGFAVIVTCDARSGVQIAAEAKAARKGPFRAFQLAFGRLQGTVTAGRPTVLVIKPGRGVLRTLRAALGRHQHISLKLTLTASSHATRTTTTKRVSAIRVG